MNLVKRNSPFIQSTLSTKRIMFNIFITLISIIIFSICKKDLTNADSILWPIISVIISMLISFAIELLFQIIFMKRRKKEQILYDIKNNYSVIPSILLILLLPYGTTMPIVIVATVCSTIVGKLVFGGFGSNTFNPTLIGILFVIVIFSGSYKDLKVNEDIAEKPIADININISDEEFEAPYNLKEYITGDIYGSSADMSTVLCIVALIFLTITKSLKWRISISYIVTTFILASIFGLIAYQDLSHGIFHILSGGFLFYAVFLAPDSVTTPVMKTGQILFGITLGILTLIFRLFTSYFFEAIIFSIIILNLFTKFFDRLALNLKYGKINSAK